MVKELIYNHFTAKELKSAERQYKTDAPHFSAHNLHGACRRKLFWQKTNAAATNSLSDHTLLKFELGHAAHRMVEDILAKSGVVKMSEELTDAEIDGVKFWFKPDAIIEVDGVKAVLEIKSTYGSGFKSNSDRPELKHLVQAVFYCTVFGIDTAVILLIGRDNGFMVEHIIKKGDPNWTEAAIYLDDRIQKLKVLAEAIKAGGPVPERDYQINAKRTPDGVSFEFQHQTVKYKTPWECHYQSPCPFFTQCWGELLGRLEAGEGRFIINGEIVE